MRKPFDEAKMCQAAYAYEQSTTWHTQHPNLEHAERRTYVIHVYT